MTSEQRADLNLRRHRLRGTIYGVVVCLLVAIAVLWFARPELKFPVRQKQGDPADRITPPSSESNAGIVSRLKNSSEIRVKLSAVKPIVSVKGRYRISPLGDLKTDVLSGTDLNSARISPSPSGNGITIGERELADGLKAVELSPEDEDFITVGSRKYRGRLRIYLNNDGGISLINVLPLELYLASVVDSEMPASFPVEARKAQAVVSRTYALVHARDHKNRPYDVTDSTRHQRYLGYQYEDRNGRLLAGETAAGRRAVEATLGMVCKFDGQLFYTYFSADCGGETNRWAELLPATALPVFTPVKDPFSQVNPKHWWQAEIPVSSVSEKTLNGKNWLSLRKFGVRSPRFEVVKKGNIFQINGLGHGHGVGFCQWGANGRAKNGARFDQILQAYFPGATVVKLDESAQKTNQ